MPIHFPYSCYKIQARKEKDLTSKLGLNLAENLRPKKRDEFVYIIGKKRIGKWKGKSSAFGIYFCSKVGFGILATAGSIE